MMRMLNNNLTDEPNYDQSFPFGEKRLSIDMLVFIANC